MRGYIPGGDSFREKLTELNYRTAAYYQLSYPSENEIEPGTSRKIEIRIKNDKARIKHRAKIATPLAFYQLDQVDRRNFVIRSALKNLIYNDISLSTNIALFPYDKDLALAHFSLEAPTKDVFHNLENNPHCSLYLLCTVYNKEGALINNFHKVFKIDWDRKNERKSINSFRYSDFLLLPAGEYKVNFFIADMENGKLANENHDPPST